MLRGLKAAGQLVDGGLVEAENTCRRMGDFRVRPGADRIGRTVQLAGIF
jgi:hypothetical protein